MAWTRGRAKAQFRVSLAGESQGLGTRRDRKRFVGENTAEVGGIGEEGGREEEGWIRRKGGRNKTEMAEWRKGILLPRSRLGGGEECREASKQRE